MIIKYRKVVYTTIAQLEVTDLFRMAHNSNGNIYIRIPDTNINSGITINCVCLTNGQLYRYPPETQVVKVIGTLNIQDEHEDWKETGSST